MPVLDKVIAALGKPFFTVDNFALYCGDCTTLLPRLPSSFVNLTVTSPPYNIGKAYERLLPLDDYVAWCGQWLTELYRVTSLGGALWLNLGYLEIPQRAKALPLPYLLWNKSPFYLLQEVVWNYGAGVSARRMFSPRNEKFLWFVRSPTRYTFNLDAVRDKNVKYPNQKKNGKLKCNPLGKNPSDVWAIPKVTSGARRSSKERTPHPAQFPVAVIDRIVRACSNAGELVLDPFIGSGSTAVAALMSGRQVVGMEISPSYCDLIAERITRFLRDRDNMELQDSLFDFGE